MKIAIVGAGTSGTALAVAWARAGHAITAVTGRAATGDRAATWLPGVPVRSVAEAVRGADLVAVSVPDDALGASAVAVARAIGPDTWVLHVSGANGLDVLEPVVAAGGRVLAVHPLQTFADVAGAIDALAGCAVAVTSRDDDGWRLGERLALDLGGRPFRLADEARALYHAAAVFGSNYLVVVSGAAQELLTAAGVPDAAAVLAPLQRATVANVHRLGPAAALTGPAVRGDAGTIERNLRSITETAPHLVGPYVSLCRASMDLAGARLSPGGRDAIEEVLRGWN